MDSKKIYILPNFLNFIVVTIIILVNYDQQDKLRFTLVAFREIDFRTRWMREARNQSLWRHLWTCVQQWSSFAAIMR